MVAHQFRLVITCVHTNSTQAASYPERDGSSLGNQDPCPRSTSRKNCLPVPRSSYQRHARRQHTRAGTSSAYHHQFTITPMHKGLMNRAQMRRPARVKRTKRMGIPPATAESCGSRIRLQLLTWTNKLIGRQSLGTGDAGNLSRVCTT